jgi:hypothetical protein
MAGHETWGQASARFEDKKEDEEAEPLQSIRSMATAAASSRAGWLPLSFYQDTT